MALGLCWCHPVALANTALVPSPPTINADSYLLVDFDTGAVLVEHNPDLQLPPASLTKLMTAYILAEEVALGRLTLDDTVLVNAMPGRRTLYSRFIAHVD